MPVFVAAVEIHLKPGALDPQGQAVAGGLRALGHGGVGAVRVGKHVRLELMADDAAGARAEVERMCAELLANPVMETYRIEIGPPAGA